MIEDQIEELLAGGADPFVIVDRMLPPWQLHKTVTVGSAACTPYDEDAGTRNGRRDDGAIFTMPYQRYVRAVDPAGFLCPLTTHTSRTPQDDTTGFEDKIKAVKRRKGWLIAERDEQANGLMGRDYGEYVLREMLRRQRENARKHVEGLKEFESQETKAIERAMKDQRAMAGEQMGQVSALFADALAQVVARLQPAAAAPDPQVDMLKDQVAALSAQVQALTQALTAPSPDGGKRR